MPYTCALDFLGLRPFVFGGQGQITHGFEIATLDIIVSYTHAITDATGPATHLVCTIMVELAAGYGCVAILRQSAGKGHVTGSEVVPEHLAAACPRQLAGRHTLSGGNAYWGGRISIIEYNTRSRKLIKNRGPHDGITLKTRDIRAMLVAHQKENVRTIVAHWALPPSATSA